jgi:hypothetical protein
MKYVMLIYQGSAPLPRFEEWAALPEKKQKQIYADYEAISEQAPRRGGHRASRRLHSRGGFASPVCAYART